MIEDMRFAGGSGFASLSKHAVGLKDILNMLGGWECILHLLL